MPNSVNGKPIISFERMSSLLLSLREDELFGERKMAMHEHRCFFGITVFDGL